MYYLKFVLLFFVLTFFVLPLFNIEDPLRTIALRYFSSQTEANLVEHICKPDRTYWYEYDVASSHYRQRYDGYVERLDAKIPENYRCQGKLTEPTPIDIKYFGGFSYWSEPVESIQESIVIIWMYILIKLGGVFILLWTFLRK